MIDDPIPAKYSPIAAQEDWWLSTLSCWTIDELATSRRPIARGVVAHAAVLLLEAAPSRGSTVVFGQARTLWRAYGKARGVHGPSSPDVAEGTRGDL